MGDDRTGVYTVISGAGVATCEEWLEVRGTGNVVENQIEAFGAGFLTAYNLYVFKGKNVARGHRTESLILWADRLIRKSALPR